MICPYCKKHGWALGNLVIMQPGHLSLNLIARLKELNYCQGSLMKLRENFNPEKHEKMQDLMRRFMRKNDEKKS